MRRLVGSREQQLVFLNMHWGGQYSFAAPAAPNGLWTATARFGLCDRLDGDSAGDLLEQVRHHYRASGPCGSWLAELPGAVVPAPRRPADTPG
jgi:hypothetical protein